MHPIQEKLLKLSQKYDLSKMGLRQLGRMIGVEHPQQVKFHLNKIGIENRKSKTTVRRTIGDDSRKMLSIPILGLANCGDATMFAEAHIEGVLPVSSKLLNRRSDKDLFAVRAVGDSMNKSNVNGKSIKDGDYVIVDSENRDVHTGDYVLSIIGGLANIKKYVEDRENRQIVLQSESDKYFPPIFIHEDDLDDYLVSGKVLKSNKNPKDYNDIIVEPISNERGN